MNLLRIFLFFYLLIGFLDAKEKVIDLQLQWKYQFQFAGFIMAKEKGFYRDSGFDVKIKEWNYSVDMVDEVIKKHSHFAVARPTSMIDISKGKEVVYLAAIYQSSPLILLTSKKSGINSLKDINKKRFTTTGDLNNDASLLSMMFSQGVDIDSLVMQKPSFDVKDLINNKTDLMASYISNEPFILKELGEEPIVFNPKDYGFEFYNDILITSKEMARNQPEDVKKFVDATLKGWEYAFANIDESVKIIFNKYNTQNKSLKSLYYEASELKKLAYYNSNRIGKLEKRKLEKIYDVYKLLGLVNKEIDFDKIVYFNPNLEVKLSPLEIEYLASKKEISMCVDPNWMPFEKIENSKHIGLSAQYFEIFKEALGVDFKLIPTQSWTQSLEYAKDRKCDILSLIMSTPKRKDFLNFTSAYLKVPLVIVTEIDKPFINDITSLNGKRLIIPKDYAFSELLKQRYPYLNISDVKDIEEGLELVESGQYYGYIGTLATVEYHFNKNFKNSLKIGGKLDESWDLGIGVRNDDATLLSILEKSVNSLDANQRENILNNWLSINYEKNLDYDLLIKIAIVISIIILFFIYKQYILKKSINEFNEIIDATMEGILISSNGVCIDCNQSTLEILGFNSKAQIKGKRVLDIIADESKDEVRKKIIEDDVEQYEATLIKADGTHIIALVRGHNLKERKVRLSSIIDITKLKRQEKLLVEQSKMAALGEMIANIAHQWRQPLATISAAATGMKLQREHNILSDDGFYDSCDSININSQYLSKTIDDFRNYIKGDKDFKRFYIKENIDSFLQLIDATLKSSHIKKIVSIEKNIQINGYPNELIQCFINLFYNSKDAFDSNTDINQRYIFIDCKIVENSLEIEFKDNAGGIPNKVLPKVFEPYFTTKHQTQGTGLGLHMTYNLIANSMNGVIEVRNDEYQYNDIHYKGACFTVKLPIL